MTYYIPTYTYPDPPEVQGERCRLRRMQRYLGRGHPGDYELYECDECGRRFEATTIRF